MTDQETAVARLRRFKARRGDVVAVIENLGLDRVRIVLIGQNGTFGDVIVGSVEAAELVCKDAGVTIGSWDRETSAQLVVSRADRRKMAGTGR